MFTLQVAELGALKSQILPLIDVASFGDIKFSQRSVSLTVSHSDQLSRLIVQLEISESFFTIFSSDGGDDYRSRIRLERFYLAMWIMGINDLYLTVLIPEVHTCTNLIFTTRAGDFRSLTPLMMSPPENENVGEFDYKVFIAIDAAKFREIATQLSVYNATIWVTASASRVKFSVRTREISREIILTEEQKQIIVGGLEFGHGVRFPVAFNPLDFFLNASVFNKLVWFTRSTDGCTLVQFMTGSCTNIQAYYPQDHWEDSPIDHLQ